MSALSNKRRVAIVEDNPQVRAHFIDIIAGSATLELASVADSLARARALHDPATDLVLLDIGLPDGSGLSLIPTLKAAGNTRVLVITSFGDRDTVVSAIEAGADGYLLKDSSAAVIEDGILVTLDGGSPISAAAAVYLLERLRGGPDTPPVSDGNDGALTPREVELLQCFALGNSYKEAARVLGISPLTVGNHVKSIYRKLAVHSRGEAVYAAVRQGHLTL